MDIVKELAQLEWFKEVPKSQLEWFADHAEVKELKAGEYVFNAGDIIDKLQVIIKGCMTIKLKKNNQFQTMGQATAPGITGLLPYSRATIAKGVGIVDEDAIVIMLDGKYFREMICDCHELTTALVHEMSTRIRRFTKREQLDDKMLSLGKLSAGLAHELNNPSAAVVRSSAELSKHLRYLPEKFKRVIKIKATDEEVDAINNLIFGKIDHGLAKLSLMDKADLEDELLDWMDDHDIDGADEIVETLLEYGVQTEDLELIKTHCKTEDLGAIIGWMNQVLTTEKLVGEIENASERINSLVTSIKSYTHMDQAPEKVKTDIHDGLDNTLTILNHKLRANKIEVVRNYGDALAQPKVLPSAINQVWTNLIDNAIDAMEDSERKQLTISTNANSKYLTVDIEDSGHGIEGNILDKIFDPFFTTKPIGKGTGLGLENVLQITKMQHDGTIEVSSEPGKTIFSITLPID